MTYQQATDGLSYRGSPFPFLLHINHCPASAAPFPDQFRKLLLDPVETTLAILAVSRLLVDPAGLFIHQLEQLFRSAS